ncbi:MAG TPA: hypothetical protein VM366_08975 [Anaerolineae bacterium]|nr:hypothetical protein [Anaerolineae bacterium]
MGRAWARYVCFLIVALTLSACIPGLSASTLPLGQTAPDFAVEVMGGAVSLGELRESIVLLNFWSST